jgi:hypothetical protein
LAAAGLAVEAVAGSGFDYTVARITNPTDKLRRHEDHASGGLRDGAAVGLAMARAERGPRMQDGSLLRVSLPEVIVQRGVPAILVPVVPEQDRRMIDVTVYESRDQRRADAFVEVQLQPVDSSSTYNQSSSHMNYFLGVAVRNAWGSVHRAPAARC